MSGLMGGRQQIPKLAKTKQLQNPYQSNTTTGSQLSRIFLLNDRNKVRLTEQSDSEDEPAHTQLGHANGLSFSRSKKHESLHWDQCQVTLARMANPNTQERTDTEFGKGRGNFSQQNVKQNSNKNAYTLNSQQVKENPVVSTDGEKGIGNMKKVGVAKEDGKQDKESQDEIGNWNRKSIHQDQSSHHDSASSSNISDVGAKVPPPKQGAEEEIAQENDIQELLQQSSHHNCLNISASRSKPSLQEASQVKGEFQEGVGRGSIIDRIKDQTFIESRVLDTHTHKIHHTTTHQHNNEHNPNIQQGPTNQAIHIPKQQSNKKQIFSQPACPKPRQRTKIFANSTTRKHDKHSPQQLIQQHVHSFSPKSRTTHIFQPEATQSHNHHHQQQSIRVGSYSICPHTQCILKSLQIIDKLTNHPHSHPHPPQSQYYSSMSQNNQEAGNLESLKQEIQSQALDISMRVDQLLVELVLTDLLEEGPGIKIRKLKYEVEQLISKVKGRDGQSQTMGKESTVTKASRLQYRWELCEQMQKICKSLHYIQIVQERYKMWKIRLHHLSERIKDILKVDKAQQVKKLGDIASHIDELEKSKFYGTEAASLGLVEAYNSFIDKEAQELKFTMEWIKSDILSD